MRRGPKPTPTHLRLLQGNPHKRSVNPIEPQPEQIPVGDATSSSAPSLKACCTCSKASRIARQATR